MPHKFMIVATYEDGTTLEDSRNKLLALGEVVQIFQPVPHLTLNVMIETENLDDGVFFVDRNQGLFPSQKRILVSRVRVDYPNQKKGRKAKLWINPLWE